MFWLHIILIFKMFFSDVENSKHNYIQTFNYDSGKIAKAEITENLWQEVENGIAGDWENIT